MEADWVSLFHRANAPGNYYAMAALSGPNEVWLVEPLPSFAAHEDYEKVFDKEALKSALSTMDARDGELRATFAIHVGGVPSGSQLSTREFQFGQNPL